MTRIDPRLLLAAACGGALGAVLRYVLGQVAPDGSGFPWTTFGINVAGSCLLALLPLLAVVRRHRAVAVALGPGLLGGFTTLSAYAEQGRTLLADGEDLLAGAYLLGTLGACLVAVALVARRVPATGAEQ